MQGRRAGAGRKRGKPQKGESGNMRNFRLDDESGHQEALFSWAAYQLGRMPELEYLHHVPNGGKRDKATATALKRQGVKAGGPDTCLPVARGGYHGLYIELKAGRNKATDNQKRWLKFLEEQGYCAAVCYGWNEAADKITEYLEMEKEKHCTECVYAETCIWRNREDNRPTECGEYKKKS